MAGRTGNLHLQLWICKILSGCSVQREEEPEGVPAHRRAQRCGTTSSKQRQVLSSLILGDTLPSPLKNDAARPCSRPAAWLQLTKESPKTAVPFLQQHRALPGGKQSSNAASTAPLPAHPSGNLSEQRV